MASDKESKALPAPPYISFKTLINLLERLQQTHLPPRIDRSYLDAMSGGYQTQVIATLRWLDLIGENGEVQPTLSALATNPDQRPAMIGELIRSRYQAVFALSSKNATQGQLEEEFRKYGITGSTLRSAIAFFLHSARYAEIPVSPHFKVPPVRSGNGKPAVRKVKSMSKGGARQEPPPPRPPEATATDPKQRYLDLLLKKAEENMDQELLDRIERLLGYEQGVGESGNQE